MDANRTTSEVITQPTPVERHRRAVQIGVCVLLTDRGCMPHTLARAVEHRELDMLFLAENSHVPLSCGDDWPQAGALKDRLSRLHDPFVALSAAAVVTTRLVLGFGVCLLTHRDPIITAKAIASLDRISGGRVVVGIAGGALDAAMRNHGSEFKHRWRITRERVEAMRAIWTQEVAEFHGDFVNFEPLVCYPKPISPQGPPVWIGSNSTRVPQRVAAYANGWIVFNGRYKGDAVRDLKAACEHSGRDFDDLSLALMNAPEEASAALRFLDRGYRKLIFMLVDDKDLLLSLDRIGRLAQTIRASL